MCVQSCLQRQMEIVNGTAIYNQFDLYKTNLDVEYVPNDLSSIFITLADISKRLNALEG